MTPERLAVAVYIVGIFAWLLSQWPTLKSSPLLQSASRNRVSRAIFIVGALSPAVLWPLVVILGVWLRAQRPSAKTLDGARGALSAQEDFELSALQPVAPACDRCTATIASPELASSLCVVDGKGGASFYVLCATCAAELADW